MMMIGKLASLWVSFHMECQTTEKQEIIFLKLQNTKLKSDERKKESVEVTNYPPKFLYVLNGERKITYSSLHNSTKENCLHQFYFSLFFIQLDCVNVRNIQTGKESLSLFESN